MLNMGVACLISLKFGHDVEEATNAPVAMTRIANKD
jgi:hypothetical protein